VDVNIHSYGNVSCFLSSEWVSCFSGIEKPKRGKKLDWTVCFSKVVHAQYLVFTQIEAPSPTRLMGMRSQQSPCAAPWSPRDSLVLTRSPLISSSRTSFSHTFPTGGRPLDPRSKNMSANGKSCMYNFFLGFLTLMIFVGC
jgi:hypothetical protein